MTIDRVNILGVQASAINISGTRRSSITAFLWRVILSSSWGFDAVSAEIDASRGLLNGQ